MTTRRGFLAGAALSVGMAHAAQYKQAAGATAHSASPRRQLRLALSSEPTSADPHFAALTPNVGLAQHVFDALVQVDAAGRYVPGLATSWRTLDPLTWEISLRSGVRFHDGSRLTADDVAFSLQRPARIIGSPAPLTTFTRSITAIKVVDSLTVRLSTHEPYGGLPGDLSSIFIVSRNAAENAQPSDFDSGKAAIGTGPFRLSRFVKGAPVNLTRNADYWGGPASWESVSMLFMPDEAMRAAALVEDKVDAIDGVSPASVDHLRVSGMQIVQRTSWRTVFLHIEQFTDRSPWIMSRSGRPLASSPLKDVRVRRALSLALDRQAAVKTLLNGFAEPACQLVPHGVLGHSAKLEIQSANQLEARRLLADAGLPLGFRLKMHATSRRYIRDEQIANDIARQWGQIGVATEVETLPAAQYFPRARQGEFSVAMLGYGSMAADFALRSLLGTPDGAKGWGTWNWSKYTSAKLDSAIRESLRTVDPLKRDQQAAYAMELAMNDQAVIPLHHQFASWAMRSGIGYVARLDEFSLAHQFIAV